MYVKKYFFVWYSTKIDGQSFKLQQKPSKPCGSEHVIFVEFGVDSLTVGTTVERVGIVDCGLVSGATGITVWGIDSGVVGELIGVVVVDNEFVSVIDDVMDVWVVVVCDGSVDALLSVVDGIGGVWGNVCGAANGVVRCGNAPNVRTSGGIGGNNCGRSRIGCVQHTNGRPLLNLSLWLHKSFLNNTKSK